MKWSGSIVWLLLWIAIGCTENVVKNSEIKAFRSEQEIQIIPQVQNLNIDSGYFELNKETVLLIWNDSTSGT